MNVPNFLTILRILMTVVFICIFKTNMIAAAILFVLASITDYLDGYWARKYHLITSFGKIMDPIADKFLVLAAFGMFAHIGAFYWWMFWIFAVREIGVTLFRFWAMSKGRVLAAEKLGKAKTVVQISSIIIFFVLLITAPFEQTYLTILIYGNFIVMYIAIILTVLSGVAVFWNNRRLFC